MQEQQEVICRISFNIFHFPFYEFSESRNSGNDKWQMSNDIW